MITWMQRHKKYLVVTIWISTIAFVGAGFVGWGAYDLNSDRATAVAKVGDRKVTVQEFQLAYANYYNFYNNMFGGQLTQEKADQLGLEKIVIKNLMEEASILSYADEIGLQALDSEVMEKLAKDENFQEKGVFNKELYYTSLKRIGVAANDYEKGLKKQIILEKLQNALNLPATASELDMIKSAIFMEDKLEVAFVSINPNDIKVSEEETKAFWEAHKDSYMSTKSFEIEYLEVKPQTTDINQDELKTFFEENKNGYTDSEGKLLSFEAALMQVTKDFSLKATKKEALKSYLAFKKGEIKAEGSKTVMADDITFPVEKLENVPSGETLKPIEIGDEYMIVKINKINEPQPKAYEEAKSEVYNTLLEQKQSDALNKVANDSLATFKGESTGFISRDTITKILDLDESESVTFLNSVFDKKEKVGYKIIGQKALLYRVLEQKLLPSVEGDKYANLLQENAVQMKKAELNQNLVKKLSERYTSEQYYKGK